MTIAIDISQIAHEGQGVARFVEQMTRAVIKEGASHTWVLFGASLRRQETFHTFYESLSPYKKRVRLVVVPIPPTLLHILWNVLHIVPVEWFIGKVDVFWSSDWIQPPLSHAVGVTTVHDVSFLRYPESFPAKIIAVQARRLSRATRECAAFFCDSRATYDDMEHYFAVPKARLHIVYPGFSPL